MLEYLKFSQRKFFVLIIFLTSVIIYSPSLKVPFVNDEISFIKRTEVSSIAQLPALFQKQDYDGFYYRPLPDFINGLTTLVFKYNYECYRIFNILLHSIAGILVFFFLLSLPFNHPKKNLIALFASLFFIVFPINDYSVIWHTDLFDKILVIFYISGLIIFLKNNLRPTTGSVLMFMLALLSKEMAFSFPLIIALLYFTFSEDKKDIRKGIISVLPYIITAIVFIMVRIYLLNNNIFIAKDTHSSSNILDIIKNYILFTGLLVFPFTLREIQVFILSHSIFTIILGLVFIIAASIFISRKVKKDAILLFFTLFILLTIAPASRLFMRWYLYLPSVGFTSLVAYLLFSLKINRKSVSIILSLIIFTIYSSALIIKEVKWVNVTTESVAMLNNFINKYRNEIVQENRITFLTLPAKIDDIPVFQLGFDNLFNYYLNAGHFIDVDIITKSFVFNINDKIPVSIEKDNVILKQLNDNYFILFNNSENVKFDNNLYNHGNIHEFDITKKELTNKILYTFSNGQFYKLQGM